MSDKKLNALVDTLSPKKHESHKVVVGILVVVVCAGAAAAYLFLRLSKSKTSTNSMKKNARIFGAYWPFGWTKPGAIACIHTSWGNDAQWVTSSSTTPQGLITSLFSHNGSIYACPKIGGDGMTNYLQPYILIAETTINDSIQSWNACGTLTNTQPFSLDIGYPQKFAMGRVELMKDTFITFDKVGNCFLQNQNCASWIKVTPPFPDDSFWFDFVVYDGHVVAAVLSTPKWLLACKINLIIPDETSQSIWFSVGGKPADWKTNNGPMAMTEYNGNIYLASMGQIWVLNGTLPNLNVQLRVELTPTIAKVVTSYTDPTTVAQKIWFTCLKVGPHPDGASLYAVCRPSPGVQTTPGEPGSSLFRLLLTDIVKKPANDPWKVVSKHAPVTNLAFLSEI